ncbi:MAG: LarC family nickel insertion protein, partial [Lachnospiraceae bacterium]|nr:LarC family nickel insertion protein [Lachnospiraceae bacterium]
MGKTLYLECNSGISGDMTVAALIDLGADSKVLTEALASLPIQGFETEISRVKKAGLDACDFNVKLDKAHENHDHDMEYLHGHTHDHGQAAAEDHAHIHSHEAGAHTHSHEHHHAHEHRGLSEILDVIARAGITKRAKEM